MKLSGKVAIVTGAGSGIGRSSAILFAREGAKVSVVDCVEGEGKATVDAIRGKGGDAIFIAADVSSSADTERMIRETVETYGSLHILFNNAGIDHPKARSVTETTEELWDRTIDVNLKGVFLGSKFAIPEILRSGGGTIINTASIAGLVGTGAEAAYCASKGGVVQLTKQMAIDYAPKGIRVNCICPGAMAEATRDRRAALDEDGKAQRDSLADLNPMHRMGESEEVARAVLFLASEDCSFVNGATLVIDGGYTAM
jgi:NAD(P)-dependent dehydrogenase (short-subunit alcohol dehydrogenase family)